MDAYKAQNIFLSREIMELNDLRTADTAGIKSLNGYYMSIIKYYFQIIYVFFRKLHELEAEHVRLQSKHIILLKEAQTPKLSEYFTH